MKRKYTDCYGETIKNVIHDKPRKKPWYHRFEPEAFVNFWICVFFGLVLFYVIYTG